MSITERINVNITRIVSPTKFWLRLKTDDHNSDPNRHVYSEANERNNLTWIKERAEWKCHLAFLGPVDINCWSLTAIDIFKTYAKQFEKLAITIPNAVNSSTQSTAVILWGSGNRCGYNVDALEAELNVWRNINLKMIFQGVARANVHIKHFNPEHCVPMHNGDQEMLLAQQNHTNWVHHLQGDAKIKRHKKVKRWLPASPCRTKEFTGIPVFINNKLEIYVQELENQKLIEQMSNELTAWHTNRTKKPTKFWTRGDICVALRRGDGKYHRAEIQRLCQKQRKCLVHFVDFGCTEFVAFENLSTYTKFIDVPIQTTKCHLSDAILISDKQTAKAVDLCKQLICNQTSTIYIHDSLDSSQSKSVACSVQSPKMQIDISSLLISLGLVQYNAHMNIENGESVTDRFHLEKRIRKKSDESIRMDSCELLAIEDFKEFYEVNKVETPVKPKANRANDIDDAHQVFEIFKSPSKRNPLGETVSPEIQIAANPLVDRITDHFSLLNVTESSFYCRPVYIIDPITILVEVDDAEPPTIDFRAHQKTKYFSLNEYSPCIAFNNYDCTWYRGIVWQKVSTNKYLILCVDTLKISEVNRKLIHACPTKLLGSKLQFAKVRLARIKPHERMRVRDICDELTITILNKDLFAKVIGVFDNGFLDIKLYEAKDARRPIYNSLIKKKFYKKIN